MQQTNFFSLMGGMPKGQYTITINNTKDQLVVTTHYIVTGQDKGKAKSIPALTFRESAVTLDRDYFGAITTPVEEKRDLYQQAARSRAAIAKAKASTSKQTASTQPGTDPKQAQFDQVMAKVRELEAQGKYRQAIGQLPKAADYPTKAAQIEAAKVELMEKAEAKEGTPSLFAGAAPAASPSTLPEQADEPLPQGEDDDAVEEEEGSEADGTDEDDSDADEEDADDPAEEGNEQEHTSFFNH